MDGTLKFNYGLFGFPRLSRFRLFFDLLAGEEDGPLNVYRRKADDEPITASDFSDS